MSPRRTSPAKEAEAAVDAMPEAPRSEPTPADAPAAASEPAVAPSPPTPAPARWQAVETQRGVRTGLLTIAIILLGVGCITAFYAAMRIASIWFEARFVPIAQLVVAAVVITVCVRVIRGLNKP